MIIPQQKQGNHFTFSLDILGQLGDGGFGYLEGIGESGLDQHNLFLSLLPY